MSIRVALNHKTRYRYDRWVTLSPQIIRLRPAPHCRTPISSYALRIEPGRHFLNWQQDPQSNFLARVVFPEKVRSFELEVDFVAELSVINPFDFFLEESAERIPFTYESWLESELRPYLETLPVGPRLAAWLATVDRSPRASVDWLVALNQRLAHETRYEIRMDPGVQTPEETLARACGSCRDSSWLLVQVLRNLGLAARFVSGYLIQLVPDEKSLDGPSGPEHDFTDLHAWAEVYLPGAGWVGLDPTSGLFAGEGHLPLAATPDPFSAAPVSGAVDECEMDFEFSMRIERIHEDPRVTHPYDDAQWQRIDALGERIDAELEAGDVRLTMGGEPTFVSIDDRDGEEWNHAALGPTKRPLAEALLQRLVARGRARRTAALRNGQVVSGRVAAALGAQRVLAPRRRSDLARSEAHREHRGAARTRTRRRAALRRDARQKTGRRSAARGAGLRRPLALPARRGASPGQRRSGRQQARRSRDARTAAPRLRARPRDAGGHRAAAAACQRGARRRVADGPVDDAIAPSRADPRRLADRPAAAAAELAVAGDRHDALGRGARPDGAARLAADASGCRVARGCIRRTAWCSGIRRGRR